MSPYKHRAFTLIELVASIAILAVLTMMTYPIIQGQALKARRNDAKQSLLWVAAQLERCYTRFRRYDSTSCPQIDTGPKVARPSRDGYYSISSANADGSQTLASESFSLYATPTGNQTQDIQCWRFSLDNRLARGARSKTDQDTTDQCW